jgi:hypothetical protein
LLGETTAQVIAAARLAEKLQPTSLLELNYFHNVNRAFIGSKPHG